MKYIFSFLLLPLVFSCLCSQEYNQKIKLVKKDGTVIEADKITRCEKNFTVYIKGSLTGVPANTLTPESYREAILKTSADLLANDQFAIDLQASAPSLDKQQLLDYVIAEYLIRRYHSIDKSIPEINESRRKLLEDDAWNSGYQQGVSHAKSGAGPISSTNLLNLAKTRYDTDFERIKYTTGWREGWFKTKGE